MLDELHTKLSTPPMKTGFAKWIPGSGKQDPDPELVGEWHCTKGGLLMNRGVFERTCGDSAAALRTYNEAESHLFDNYIKAQGPQSDLEATGKVVNLWENTMRAALETGDGDRAAEVTFNAIKLHSYWGAQNMETPDLINEALASFVSGIAECDAKQRDLLDSHLPEPIKNIVGAMLADFAE